MPVIIILVISSIVQGVDAENIKIYLRIRPWLDGLPLSDGQVRRTCAPSVIPTESNAVAFTGSGAKVQEHFLYDYVGGPETAQGEVFEAVAKPLIDNCLLGYNATIFAYGQTGSGKTFTMQGPPLEPIDRSTVNKSPLPPSSLPILISASGKNSEGSDKGIIPRTFEYLFERIAQETDCSYTCKCSYVEIYNEVIYDLLDPNGRVCNLREDVRAGVFIEDCQMIALTGPPQAHTVFARGAANRHVAETAMNRESSRSHSVFTLYIQSRKEEGDLIDLTESRFNLVDLAGSERQQLAGTTGLRLKEAGNINKSLLALSNVINALVELANGRPRHVHYRDSKLTFLLRDSLGGNAKTCIIANVSPAPACQAETLSTLRFAQRAKLIKNKAIVNKDIHGSYSQLQAEIKRLQAELAMLKASKSFSKLDLAASLESLGASLDYSSGNGLSAAEHCSIQEILQHSLIHQNHLAQELLQARNKLEQLEEISRRKDQQIQTERLIVKFRENTIKSLQRTRESHLLDDGHAERSQMLEELAHWKRLYDQHPDVTRFAYENMILRDRLAKMDGGLVAAMEKSEAEILRLGDFVDALSARIIMIEKEREGLLQDAQKELEDVNRDELADQSRMCYQSERNELEARLNELQSSYETAQENLCEAHRLLAEARAEIDRLQTEASKRRRLEEDEEHLAQAAKWAAERSDLLALQERIQGDFDLVTADLDRVRSELHAYEQAKVAWDLERREKEWIRQTERSNYEERIKTLQEESTARLDRTIEQSKREHEAAIQDYARQNLRNRLQELEEGKSFGAKVEELQNDLGRLRAEKQQLQGQMEKLHFQLQSSQQDNEDLLAKLESSNGSLSADLSKAQSELIALRDQIAAVERDNEALQMEISRLRTENERLIQHQNLKQKLQYHVKIKQENNELKEENRLLREELSKK